MSPINPWPDLMLLTPREDFYRTAHPTPEDALLVVEVAETAVAHDRRRKLPLYARTGVPEVWTAAFPDLHLSVDDVLGPPSAAHRET